ncbi:hypothetical protein UlMin_021347 [Ulmus minor]
MAAPETRDEELSDNDDHYHSCEDTLAHSPTFMPSHFAIALSQSTLANHKILIPQEFVREFGRQLCTFAILIVPYGRTWSVELEKEGNNIWFSRGWKEFVEYYIGLDAYLLTFIHGGDSTFYVLICNSMSGYQIKYPFGQRNFESVGVKSKKVDNKEDAKLFFTKKFSFLRQKMSKKTDKAIRAAKRCKLENPCFLAVLRSQRHLDVPSEFVKKHMKECSEYIQIEGQNEKQWLVYCKFRESTSCKRISGGWHAFSVENHLEKGDVCVFELIKKGNNPVLKAWIYRAAQCAPLPNKLD